MLPETILALINMTEANAKRVIGIALLQVMNDHNLSRADVGVKLGRSKVMVAKYIAGEEQMGFLVLLRALNAYPEITKKLEELT